MTPLCGKDDEEGGHHKDCAHDNLYGLSQGFKNIAVLVHLNVSAKYVKCWLWTNTSRSIYLQRSEWPSHVQEWLKNAFFRGCRWNGETNIWIWTKVRLRLLSGWIGFCGSG